MDYYTARNRSDPQLHQTTRASLPDLTVNKDARHHKRIISIHSSRKGKANQHREKSLFVFGEEACTKEPHLGLDPLLYMNYTS